MTQETMVGTPAEDVAILLDVARSRTIPHDSTQEDGTVTQETMVGTPAEDVAIREPLDEGTPVPKKQEAEPAHVLRIGGQEFVCRDELPLTVFVRYAENDFLFKHHLLTYLVDPSEHEAMWDAAEDAGVDGRALDVAIRDLLGTYMARPTGAPKS